MQELRYATLRHFWLKLTKKRSIKKEFNYTKKIISILSELSAIPTIIISEDRHKPFAAIDVA